MRGKRKFKNYNSTTQLPNDQLMNSDSNFEVGSTSMNHNTMFELRSTSMRQDRKRSKLYNGLGQFNVEAAIDQSASVHEQEHLGVSPFYVDLGDCDQICRHCNALYWYEERLKASVKGRVLYNRCCRGGAIVLPMEPEPPNYIKDLYRNRHFLDNVRAYNQMFNMTSFGAHIDESVNRGKGLYVFKISGQIYHWIGTLCPTEGDPPRFLQLYIYDTQNEITNRMLHFGGRDSGNLSSEILNGLITFLNEHNELVKLFRTAKDKCKEKDVPEFKIRQYSVVGLRQYELPTSETLGAIVFEGSGKSETDYDVII